MRRGKTLPLRILAGGILLAVIPLLFSCGGDEETPRFETMEEFFDAAGHVPSQAEADRAAEESIEAGDLEEELERLRKEILGEK